MKVSTDELGDVDETPNWGYCCRNADHDRLIVRDFYGASRTVAGTVLQVFFSGDGDGPGAFLLYRKVALKGPLSGCPQRSPSRVGRLAHEFSI